VLCGDVFQFGDYGMGGGFGDGFGTGFGDGGEGAGAAEAAPAAATHTPAAPAAPAQPTPEAAAAQMPQHMDQGAAQMMAGVMPAYYGGMQGYTFMGMPHGYHGYDGTEQPDYSRLSQMQYADPSQYSTQVGDRLALSVAGVH
jgi:hypothetical protein